MVRLFDLPLIVLLMGVGALSMWVPVAHALALEDWRTAHVFGLSTVLFTFMTAVLGVALGSHRSRNHERSHLVGLVGAYTVIPLMLAVPFQQALQSTTFTNAWFEMVSSMTTTGATLYDTARLSPTLHLWRALVGWMGGFLIWVAAFALLAPMNLGGFEVIRPEQGRAGARVGRRLGPGNVSHPRERILRFALQFLPIYAGLTFALGIGLSALGEAPTTAACHAMSTLATSGISNVGGMEGAQAGIAGEALILVFLVFALSRLTYSRRVILVGPRNIFSDPEIRISLSVLVLVPSLLFLRHWIGAYEVDMVAELPSALHALWGSVFSVMSFLTTTGFVSSEWDVASAWSGLQTPGLVLLGLGLIGGGVATTAGGVKLLRVYALYRHSSREMERLIYPSSVGGQGSAERRLRTRGAYVAWIFFMLFALSLTGVSIALSSRGVAFDQSIVLAVATLSTAGPGAEVVLSRPVDYAMLDDPAKFILIFAMALGRLETLVVLGLLNPQFWRR